MRKCTVDGCDEDFYNGSRCQPHYNEYMRVYMLARYHRRRGEWIENLGGKCDVCGTTENLEFDHLIAEEKESDIGKILSSGSNAKVAYEMVKCHLLCHEHHLEKSFASGDMRNSPHGGGKMGKDKCKCDLCRTQKNAYMREWKCNKRLKEVSAFQSNSTAE